MSKLKKQIVFFGFSGIFAVLIDFSVYMLLRKVVATPIAKGTSFFCGTIFAYYFNKFLTFQAEGRSFIEFISFIALYSVSLLVNVTVNQLILHFNGSLVYMAFLSATGVSATLNFLGQKFLIFKK